MDISRELDLTDKDSAVQAFRMESFPCNPTPFLIRLRNIVVARGTGSIQSDEAKAVLWIVMSQAFGQMAVIDLSDEWIRLDKAIPKPKED